MLESLLVGVSDGGPCPLESPIDPTSGLMSLGLDSMTVVQVSLCLCLCLCLSLSLCLRLKLKGLFLYTGDVLFQAC